MLLNIEKIALIKNLCNEKLLKNKKGFYPFMYYF